MHVTNLLFRFVHSKDIETPSRSSWDDNESARRHPSSEWDMPSPARSSQGDVSSRSHRRETFDRRYVCLISVVFTLFSKFHCFRDSVLLQFCIDELQHN